MWCCAKIKWSEKVTNEQVLELTGEKRTLQNNILNKNLLVVCKVSLRTINLPDNVIRKR